MHQIVVILGSKRDLEPLENAGFFHVLEKVRVSYTVSIISAHRNPINLQSYCEVKYREGTLVFVGVAGMAAALPGAIASYVCKRPVIGVPLPSSRFPDATDARLAMTQMPPGVPVAVCEGPYNAAIFACQILALTSTEIRDRLTEFLRSSAKLTEIDIQTSSMESK